MNSCSPVIERAKPLLGTTVSVRVGGLPPARAHAAIDAAFAEIRSVHAAMSFHEPDSDVTRLNCQAHLCPIAVGAATCAVIARAYTFSEISGGAFDITIAPQLVARGLLPRPALAPEPERTANWRDIEILPENRIRFARPLWIDLGGIAKGYAVDRAIEALKNFDPARASVNAGGDLRIIGDAEECVGLELRGLDADDVPLIMLKNGSIASSQTDDHGAHIGAHSGQFAAVVAPRCIDADALTKVVLARGAESAKCLAAYKAHAHLFHPSRGWRHIEGQA